jgi:NADPH:quinone reductase-like Zn-dependent oxidoreductase
MKAVTFAEFGGPEVLQITEKPDPTPAAGEVTVAVTASTVNPTDLMTLGGLRAPLMADLPRPYTAGMDFSGHISAVGDGVTSVRPGQAVIGVANPRSTAGGAHAQVLRVPAASVAPVGENTDLVAAATVPMNALTALLCLELLGLRPGQTLLVTGATGMLGSLSAEIALLDGLDVVVNAADKDKDFLAGLGLKTILPRDVADLASALRTAYPEGVDGVIDGALIGQQISHLVRDGGGIVSPRASYTIDDPRLKVDYVQVTKGVEDADKIGRISTLLGAGQVTPRVAPDGVFPYTDAAAAYARAKAVGLRGRVVITFTD